MAQTQTDERHEGPIASGSTTSGTADQLSTIVITLLKGVIYNEMDSHLWSAVLKLQARVRDYVSVMGLTKLKVIVSCVPSSTMAATKMQ
jgi:hypothetical protein